MLSFLRKLCAPPAAPQPFLPPAPTVAHLPTLPATTPPVPAVPDGYPPRLGTSAIFFDEHFTLCLARDYDDLWASESSLLASSSQPVSVWVRNEADELVAFHRFEAAPIHLGDNWWPGIYSLSVEHPDFRDVLCAVKRGPWGAAKMPRLDLLAPLDAPASPRPTKCQTCYPLLLPEQLPGSSTSADETEPGTGATLIS